MNKISNIDKIKILICSTSGFEKREGISTIIFDYFSRFDKNLFEIHLAVSGKYNEELISEFENCGFYVDYLSARKKVLNKYIKDLFHLFKREQFSVIYTNGSSSSMSLELLVAKMNGCKVRIAHSHNTTCNHKLVDAFLRPFFYSLCTDFFACGNDAGKWLFNNRHYTVIKNARNLSKYRYDETLRKSIRDRLNISDDCLLIGHVGRFNNQKNQQFAIHVFADIKRKHKASKLFLMGDGAKLEEIKKMAIEFGVADDVVFTGSIDNVNEMLQAMDVMLLPSVHEGLPLVVVEWQMAALPSLISDKITRECVFSNLVYFESLDSDYSKWADTLLSISNIDRDTESKRISQLARISGYDLNDNIMKLQKYIIERLQLKVIHN